MRRLLLVLFASSLLSACGTIQFKPTEYPLRDGLIPEFKLAGTVAVASGQNSAEPVIVYSYAGSKLSSDLNSITAVMVQQTQKEIAKNGRPTGASAQKTMSIKVTSLVSEYIAFYWKSKIAFQVTLGSGQVIDFNVRHGSGSLQQDLNGCIAEGVWNMLKDPRVTDYLSS